jgi:hypothetical protein
VELDLDSDWMGSAWHGEDDELHLSYRFRYYEDNKSFDSEDRKVWYDMTIHGDTPEAVEKLVDTIRMLITEMERIGIAGEAYELMMGPGGIDEMMKIFEAMPFTHVLTVPINKEDD